MGVWGMLNIIHMLEQGGVVVSVLLGLSVIGLTVILVKAWQFWRLRADPTLGADALAAACVAQHFPPSHSPRDPRSRMLHHISGLLIKGALAEADLRQESLRKARELIAELSAHLRLLEVIANVAPLLGLFGTVLGMIEAFKAMELAGSQVDPAVLSGGIWQALLTTAVGLGVAIPVSMAHSWFERRVEVQAASLQDSMDRVFTLLGSRPASALLSQAKAA